MCSVRNLWCWYTSWGTDGWWLDSWTAAWGRRAMTSNWDRNKLFPSTAVSYLVSPASSSPVHSDMSKWVRDRREGWPPLLTTLSTEDTMGQPGVESTVCTVCTVCPVLTGCIIKSVQSGVVFQIDWHWKQVNRNNMFIKNTHCSLFACFALSLDSIYTTKPTSLINLLKRNIYSWVRAFDQSIFLQ